MEKTIRQYWEKDAPPLPLTVIEPALQAFGYQKRESRDGETFWQHYRNSRGQAVNLCYSHDGKAIAPEDTKSLLYTVEVQMLSTGHKDFDIKSALLNYERHQQMLTNSRTFDTLLDGISAHPDTKVIRSYALNAEGIVHTRVKIHDKRDGWRTLEDSRDHVPRERRVASNRHGNMAPNSVHRLQRMADELAARDERDATTGSWAPEPRGR